MNIIELNAGENTAEATRQAGIATAAATTAATQADRAELAAQTTVAASRYFTSQALGEAGSTTGQLFSYDDGAGNLIFRKKTSGGSVEVARAVTPQTLLNYVPRDAGSDIATNGGRFGITTKAIPLGGDKRGAGHIENDDDAPAGLVVTSLWDQASGLPIDNNDDTLFETHVKVQSNTTIRTWCVSAPQYIDIPAGVTVTGELVGVYGWPMSVTKTGFTHAGTLAGQVGVRGRAGFKGSGRPNTAKVHLARAVHGQIVSEDPNATMDLAIVGDYDSIDPVGPIGINIAVRGRARGGTEADYSFFGEMGNLYQVDTAFFGLSSLTASQSSPAITARGDPPNAVEFGNGDAAGFGSNLGGTAASGVPFLAFNAEADPTGNTFRTRGKKGLTLTTDLNGALQFGRLTNANTSGQTPTVDITLRADGHAEFALSPVAPGYSVEGTQVLGPQGAAIADVAAAAAAPTQAEFNALVAAFNTLLERVRTHGLIAQ